MIAAFLTAALAPNMAQEINKLGPASDVHSLERIAHFGCAAVPQLVRNLKATDITEEKLSSAAKPGALKLVWTVAALRYISGQDFRSPHASNSSPVGRQMLRSGGPGGKIFGVWASRELVYFNSVTTQRSIISKWVRFSRTGGCRPGAVNSDVSFWLYGRKTQRALSD